MMSIDWKQHSFKTMSESYFYAFWLSHTNLCTVSSEDSHILGDENSSWISPDQEITKILVEDFKQVPQVKSICAYFCPEEITIWTLLDSYDRDAREKVYEKELEICKQLRTHDFDFRVTSIDLVAPDELIRTGAYQIYRRQ
jgi:hypothetical protein